MQDVVDLLWFCLPQDSLTVWTSLEQYQLLPLVEYLVQVPKARFTAMFPLFPPFLDSF